MKKDKEFNMSQLELGQKLLGTSSVFFTAMVCWISTLMSKTTNPEPMYALLSFVVLIVFIILDFNFYKFLYIKNKQFANFLTVSLIVHCILIIIVLFTEPSSIWKDIAVLIYFLYSIVFFIYTMKSYNKIMNHISK